MCVEQENWKQAAVRASNLSELLLDLGDVAAALASGEAAIEYSNRNGNAFQYMRYRITLADARHQAGDLTGALALAEAAKAFREEGESLNSTLYNVSQHQYYDLLITLGQAEAVRGQALQSLEIPMCNRSLLAVALDHLSLGCAALALGDWNEARPRLDQAVDGLRKAGRIDHIPRGLLARAAFFREVEEFAKSRHDLDEAVRIATRCGMRLFECDAHLESARLEIKLGQHGKAREHLEKAAKLVEECGYHRRDKEVEELEAART